MRRSILISMFCCSLISLSSYLAAPTLAANTGSDADVVMTSEVVSLENKFFNHPFAQETLAARVERLEKMVFGEARTGSMQDRIIAMTATVLNPSIDAPEKPATDATAVKPAELQALPTPALQSIPVEQPKVAAAAEQPKVIAAAEQPKVTVAAEAPMDYPRVTQLEQQMLGKTFVNESVSQRLVRLENKAFGAVSSSDDLSSRTDALAQYAQFFTESQPAKSTAVAETAPTTTVKSPVRSSAVAEAVPTTGYVLNLNAPVQYRKAYRTW
jgi:hypothetical protein